MNTRVSSISTTLMMKGHGLNRLLLILLYLVLDFGGTSVAASDDEPLDFSFIKSPPGEFIDLESHRLHVACVGEGSVTVLFEPGLGGSAFEWQPIQQKVAEHAHACVYDRAGYGWSDRSPFNGDVRQLASEADQMLKHVADDNKLILVGHSYGGFIARMLTRLRSEKVVGMVLVDASHEDQLDRMETEGKTRILPSSNNFVISQTTAPENLPREISRKIKAFLRMRKTYLATEREIRSFRASVDQIKKLGDSYSFPLTVLLRGRNPMSAEKDGEARHQIWGELQQNLAELSSVGKLVVAENSGHHVHIDEPELVIEAIVSMLPKEE